MSFTYAKVIFFSVTGFVVMMVIALFLSKGLLSFLFDPRYEQMQTQMELVRLNKEIDSLASSLDRKERFVQQFKAIVNGSDTLSLDTTPGQQAMLSPDEKLQTMNQDIDLEEDMRLDSAFRSRFEQDDPILQLSLSSINEAELRQTFFFSPITGVVSSPFNPRISHFGTDIVSRPNEPVLSIADGTVIFADWTQKNGYVIAVQHRQNIISVYKHNNELLKKVGNFVSAGDVISIVGNTGELSDGHHLHFELWSNGNPVNPEEFVTFF